MRRTGTRVRGRRFAALVVTAAVAVGVSSPAAFAIDDIRALEWHLDAMHAPEMWQTTNGSGFTIALIDSGVKADLPDLAGQTLPGMDFSGLPGGVTTDQNGHGTMMASMIAGTGKGLGGKGAFGLAPGAKIMPLKTNIGGNGEAVSVDSSSGRQIDQAITYAADHGAKVISISLGIPKSTLTQDDLAAMKAAVDHAVARGSLIFAAVGNSGDGDNHVEYPAAMPGVVGVTATDKDGKTTSESEHGPQVVLAAPGKDIPAACTGPTGYCSGHGTSDATALTSAAAALVWSAHPDWTGNQVLRVLINTASKPQDGSSRSDFLGYGIIRPRVALSSPGDPGPADVSPLQAAAPTGGATGSSSGASAPASAPANDSGNTPGTGAAASPSAKKSSSMGLVIGGVLVALLLLVVVVVLIARSRKSTPPPMAPMPGGYPGQQPPQPPYPGGYPMQQQPPMPGAFPPPPQQGPNPPQGGNPYAR